MSDCYHNNLEHIQDELRRIDLLLQHHIHEIRTNWQKKTVERIPGLYIADEEVDLILGSKKEKDPVEAEEKTEEREQQGHLLDALDTLTQKIEAKMKESLQNGLPLAADQLTKIFRLSPFEMQALYICLAPELNSKYQKLYAYAQDDITKKAPCVDLICTLFCKSFEEKVYALRFFNGRAPLIKYELLSFKDPSRENDLPLISRPLRINERILSFLLGFYETDNRLSDFSRLVFPKSGLGNLVLSAVKQDFLKNIMNSLHSRTPSGVDATKTGTEQNTPFFQKAVFYFYGPPGSGKKSVSEALCMDLGVPLLQVDLPKILQQEEISFEKALRLVFREGLLLPCAVYFDHFDSLLREEDRSVDRRKIFINLLEELSWLTFIAGENLWLPAELPFPFLSIDFPVPSYDLRRKIWEASLDHRLPPTEIDMDDLANKFQFTAGQIKNAAVTAQNIALQKTLRNDSFTCDDLYRSCRLQSNQKLSGLACKLTPQYTWQDIVLPEDKVTLLKEITEHVRYQHKVYHQWGFEKRLSLGKGLNIIFSGPSGTGKTMAAEIIANDLALDIYKIDLSLVVSKYIGETEKNLNKIFSEAATSNAILFFDEADALFGKRSEVRDSHDRYANIEISYLLQKMEEHNGIVILATNLRKNMDEAFMRRLHFSIDFPFPEEPQRDLIWRGMFPKDSPRTENLDYGFLAEKLKLAGGNIKNIVLTAAFYAAAESTIIDLRHIIRATKREYQKLGKAFVKEDFRPYSDLS